MKMQVLVFQLLLPVFLLLLFSCGEKKAEQKAVNVARPLVESEGQRIVMPDTQTVNYFQFRPLDNKDLEAAMRAPARVVALVVPSQEAQGQNLVLFDNPKLTNNYTQLLQHTINIRRIQGVNLRQRRIELDRAKDLQANGAASGKEVLEAQTNLAIEETNLANEEAANIEHESILRLAGFEPVRLLKAAAGTVWVICELPENRAEKIQENSLCEMVFASLPQETYAGKVESVGNVIDNITRLVKIRILLLQPSPRLRAGMYGTVSFKVSQGDNIAIPKEALVTVQGKDYVFVKQGIRTFIRRQVTTGQQLGDRVVVYSGLSTHDTLVTAGVMQLKGLSFGY
jgi:cobalt-zinc-cadmium efflux system membrane fusion protein